MSADPSQGAFHGLRSRNHTTNASNGSYHSASLKPTPSLPSSPSLPFSTARRPKSPILKNARGKQTQRKTQNKRVAFKLSPEIKTFTRKDPTPTDSEDTEDSSSFSSSDEDTGIDSDEAMPAENRPKLKLSFSKNNAPSQPIIATPAPQSANRTPSIKITFKKAPGVPTPSPLPASTPVSKAKRKSKAANGDAPTSAKKRKLENEIEHETSEDELSHRTQPLRKLTLTQKPVITPTVKIKYKGRIPKRPLGVGYDSELSETEKDPTILESFVLRMVPGPDCDYLRNAIDQGTIGVARGQGGADVQMKFLTRDGHRALVIIQQRKWAATLVDLPCIIEGMKSWDKKGWLKSADICQMLLVLGRVESDEEALHFKLPLEVDPETFLYAHGLTPPMRWVRKRRFARTKRTKITDIEAVEKRVNQLLAEDDAAVSSRYEVFDHDPRQNSANYSSDYEEESEEGGDEDAEGEDVDDYFNMPNGTHSRMMETPLVGETPAAEIDDEEVDDFEKLMEDGGDDEDISHVVNGDFLPDVHGLQVPEGESSIAVTSTSASPATAAATPATAADASSDDDEDDDDGSDGGSAESMDEADMEAMQKIQQARDNIQEMEDKIREQLQLYKQQTNPILQRKIMQKITMLRGDQDQMRKENGLLEDEGDD